MSDLLSDLERRLDEANARGLANAVSRAIRDDVLTAGTKLPPIRTVARELGLSPTTVSSAWSLLARSGTIRTNGRRGTTVADMASGGSVRYRQAMEHATTFDLDLSTGIPDPRLLPDLSRAVRTLTTAATPGGYLDDPVLPELMDALRGDWPYDAEEFTVADGAMDAISMAAQRLVRFGDRVIVEHPGFPPLTDLLVAAGAEVVGVPLDSEGMRADSFAEALASPAAAVFLQPRAHNPTGVSMTRGRAQELAAILRTTGTPVIEDDSAGYVSATPAISLGEWVPEQTLHVRSFSKSHGPDLRLAAMSGPTETMREINGRRQLGQGWTSRLLQRILLELLTEERAIEQVADAAREYRRRRGAVVDALADYGVPVTGVDGINIWMPVMDESAAIVRLASQGIGVTPGAPFAVLPDQPGHVRVTVGLVSDGHERLADQLATAARTGGWRGGR